MTFYDRCIIGWFFLAFFQCVVSTPFHPITADKVGPFSSQETCEKARELTTLRYDKSILMWRGVYPATAFCWEDK